MKTYLVALGAGALVGVIYGLLGVRSPAPPVIALIGLLGILVGEQVVPVVKRLASHGTVTVGWLGDQCAPHVFGSLPAGRSSDATQRADRLHANPKEHRDAA